MERAELLSIIENDLVMVKQYRDKEDEHYSLDSGRGYYAHNNANLRRKWGSIIGMPIIFILFNIINPFSENTIFDSLVYGLITGFILYIILTKFADIKYKFKIEKLSTELDHLSKVYLKKSGMPENFKNMHKVERFHYFLTHHIADNLKECSKLYYQEEQNEQLISSMETVADSVWDANDSLVNEVRSVNANLDSLNKNVQSVERSANAVEWNTTK